MSSFHSQIIALKNSHSEFLPSIVYVTILTSFQENDPSFRLVRKRNPPKSCTTLWPNIAVAYSGVFFKERHLHSCLLSHQVKASPSHEVLTVLGRDGAPPYQHARARQIGSGTISKSLPRTSITSRRKRPPSLVSEENCKKSRSAVSHNPMNGIKFIHQ